MLPFVDLAIWEEHRGDWVTADVRWYPDGRSGRAAYDAGHAEGAVFVDLEGALSGAASDAAGRHPLPDPAAFAADLAALGIGDDDTVVAYDDAGGVIAARLVWMLRATGRAAALLDGRPELDSTAPVTRAPATFGPRPWPPELLATIDELDTGVLLDARPRERFAGAPDPLDPRPGHIPGARSLPCREHVGADGRLLAPEELRARFAAVGVEAGTAVVSSCGSGVTACHTLLALEHAGFAPGRLFPGSYSQWSRTDRPTSSGPA